jgi:tellurite resistance protein TerC
VLHFVHPHADGVPEISTAASLLVIAAILAVTTVASVIKTRHDPQTRAHAGSLRGEERTRFRGQGKMDPTPTAA